jgi:hypothetical protein
LLLWKKDGEALVRMELEASTQQSISLGELLPGGTEIDQSLNIIFVAEGGDWISAIMAHNVANQRVSQRLFLSP